MARRILSLRSGLFILLGALALLWLGVALDFRAQTAKPIDIAGDWKGVLAERLHLIVHISRDSKGNLSVDLDSVDQHAFGLPGAKAVQKGGKFSFEVPVVHGTYDGTVSSDGKTISGTWNQGTPLVLDLTRISGAPPVHYADAMAGTWHGVIVAGGQSVRVTLHVKAGSDGSLRGTTDLPDDHMSDITADQVALAGSRFSFYVPATGGTYVGDLSDDSNSISGSMTESGVSLPLKFIREGSEPMPTPLPTPTPAPAMHAMTLDDLKQQLDREMTPVLQTGDLSQASGGGGLVLGVLDQGQRRIFAYGAARPDSIYEIGSITKTFTGLILAQMVVQKKVRLDEPVRELLPLGFVAKPTGPEISLLDLATQHSGLPRMPDNFKPKNPNNPFADYGVAQLREFLQKRGVGKPANPPFCYSNLGFALLGYALSVRAGVPYSQLLTTEVLGPWHMTETMLTLSPQMRPRLIQGFDTDFNPTGPWDLGVFESAGAIKSTAADMLTYLDANMHPQKYAAGAAPGSPAATLPAAVALDHQLRAKVRLNGDNMIALAWGFEVKTGQYGHAGGTGGYNTIALFNPKMDYAVVALYNRDSMDLAAPRFVYRVAENTAELLAGRPAIPIDYISESEREALVPQTFSNSSIMGNYHCALTAFSLPPTVKDSFSPTASGDLHIVADGKGNLTSGTWVHSIKEPNGVMVCKLNMVSGSYAIGTNGVGTERSSWKLALDESPRRCFQFFSPARPPVTSDSQVIVTGPSGKTNYATSINPFSVITTVCERQTSQ
jgi:serine-type D-Ala-D-Ala carboxypeptidase/endopeptidase